MAFKTITFGSKEFLQGISPLQQFPNTTGGFFATATAMDVFRYPGMIAPGAKPTAVTGTTITEQPKALQVNSSGEGYLMTTGKLYRFDPTYLSLSASPHTLSGSVTYPHSILRATVFFVSANNSEVIYFTDSDIGVTDGSTYTDNWGSTVPTGATSLLTGVHRACVFNSLLYFTNSTYVGVYDYTTGTHGTLNALKLQMPNGYVAKDIFVLGNALQIVADNSFQSIIITWDGTSTLPDSIENLDDSSILGAQTVEGFPHVLTTGRGYGSVIRKKNYFGYPQVQTITGNFNQGVVSSANGMLFLGDTYTNRVWSYGTPFAQYSYRGLESQGQFPEILASPFKPSGSNIDCVAQGINGMLAASHSGSTNYLEFFPFVYTNFDNANAQFRINDVLLPNDSALEKVIFYASSVGANAAFTPQIVADGAVVYNGDDMTSSTLDANGKSKTYFVGGALADSFSIVGTWTNSTTSSASVILNKIDVVINTK